MAKGRQLFPALLSSGNVISISRQRYAETTHHAIYHDGLQISLGERVAPFPSLPWTPDEN
jgi:hypothetical protein